jgi:hypothetical protein
MAVHHHHHEEAHEPHETHDRTTIVSGDRSGPAAALIAVIALLLVAFLVWFFAFSGVVFNRTGPSRGSTTRIEQNTNNNTNGNGGVGGQTQPSTVPSAAST